MSDPTKNQDRLDELKVQRAEAEVEHVKAHTALLNADARKSTARAKLFEQEVN